MSSSPPRHTVTMFSEVAGGLGGDFDYFKQIFQVNWYAGREKLTLRNKWRFGYVALMGRSNDAPPMKFYLGGTGVDGIRGYPIVQLTAGGGTRHYLSTEMGYPIAGDQIIAVAFFDAGNSYNKLRDFNFWSCAKVPEPASASAVPLA